MSWVIALQRGYLHTDLARLHDKYGPIVRIAPDELSYIDAQAWEDIYTSHPGRQRMERNNVWFRKAQPDEPWSIMASDEDAHARFRRAFMGAFNEKAIKEQASLIEKYVGLMMQKFKEAVGGGKEKATVDLSAWLNFVTFDISSDLSFGDSFGSTANGEAHPWVDIACRFGRGVALVASINHYPAIQRLLKYILPSNVRQKIDYHKKLSAQKVRQRLELQEERPDFVNSVLKYNQEKAQSLKVTLKELQLNMSVIVFAGSETTSTALTATVFHLLRHEDAMSKAVQEVRSTFDREEAITIASTSNLEYLTAVINEGIRLAPPSAIGVPRVVPEGGDHICGKWVPSGVSASTYLAAKEEQR